MTIEQVKQDFEEIKKIKQAQERAELIQQKTKEWMDLSSQYNTILYQAFDEKDESLLDNAVEIKEAMIAKQAEIDALNKA